MCQLLYLGILYFLWQSYPHSRVISTHTSQDGNFNLIVAFLEFHFFLFMLRLSHFALLKAESDYTGDIIIIIIILCHYFSAFPESKRSPQGAASSSCGCWKVATVLQTVT